MAIRTPDSKRTLSDLDKGVQSLSVDEDVLNLPVDGLDEGVQSLSVDKDIVLGDKDEGVQSLPVNGLDEGVQSLTLDEDGLFDGEVPSLDVHEAVVPNIKPSPSKLRKKQRTKEENLAIDLKGWNLTYVSIDIQNLI